MSDGAASGSGSWADVLGGIASTIGNVYLNKSNNQTAVDLAKAQAGATSAGLPTPVIVSTPPTGAAGSPAIAQSVRGFDFASLTTPLLVAGGLFLVWKLAS